VIDPRRLRPLALGADEVRRLLPHRPPLLLVDAVTAFSPEVPALRAMKEISAAEPVFAGHFPGFPVWPGVYTVEGLAQACALCGALQDGPAQTALLAAVNVKLLRPARAGDRLDYLVAHTHQVDALHRFEVEAAVGGQAVASGTLTLAMQAAK